MKRIFLLLALLAMVAMAEAQTGTIVDNGPYISFNYASGDTVCLGKENIVLIKAHNDEVFIMTSHQWRSDRITRIIHLDPDDFGYSSTGALRDYLATISFNAHTEVYSYENGNLDTVSYYYNSERQYRVVYGYTDALVTSKTIVTQ